MKNNLNSNIRNRLFDMKTEHLRSFSSKLLPGVPNILGVSIPNLRNLAKEIIKNDWKSYLTNPYDFYFEEIMLQGLVIGYLKEDFKTILKFVDEFIPKIDNWQVCDIFSSSLKITKNNMGEMWDFLTKFYQSNSTFQLRFLIVMILNYYISADYLYECFHIFNSIDTQEYYVNMAIAWAISSFYIDFPNETISFIKNNNLNKFTHNKSIQKICESKRVSDEEKIYIRSLKI